MVSSGIAGGDVGRKREGRFERDPEPGDLPQRSLERRQTRLVHVVAAILEQRERRALAGEFGGVGAGNAAPVARQVDAADGRAAGDVALRQKLLLDGIERERDLGQIGELRLRAQPEAEGDGIAGKPPLRARRVAIDEAPRRAASLPSAATGLMPLATTMPRARSAATYHRPLAKVLPPRSRPGTARRFAAKGVVSSTAATPPPALAYW